jgi:hypothetical protein
MVVVPVQSLNAKPFFWNVVRATCAYPNIATEQ